MFKHIQLIWNSAKQDMVFHLCTVGTLVILTGCASLSQKLSIDKKQQELELKKKNYQTLLQQVSQKTLLQGLSTEEVRNVYGKPDDIYRVGSSKGSTEVWTYGKGKDFIEPEDWHPIRLYFDNDHLIDWNY